MKIKPTYVDIHIHTSDNPNDLNQNYDKDSLVKNIKKKSLDHPILISLTDHNAINKHAYLAFIKETDINLILGAEIHIRKNKDRDPYHCHILFNSEINEENIDKINTVLDKLYPNKVIDDSTENVPYIENISEAFDDYDYIMLPHGGQNHRTFNSALQSGRRLDTMLERSVYFNQFDGFTSRSNSGLEDTIDYFKKLGINEFINSVTCSDNYKPSNYPQAKSSKAESFFPTWMYATPTFDGLRLSLSESTRLYVGITPPEQWSQIIEKVVLNNKKVDIDVSLSPGLNVVIGGSSSGKTMFVDMVSRNISNNYESCVYDDFGIKDVSIVNISGVTPHYINQSFIVSVLQNSNRSINEIPLIAKVFPEDKSTENSIRQNLQEFKVHLNALIDSVENIENYQDRLSKIPKPTSLIFIGDVEENIFDLIKPSDGVMQNIKLTEANYFKHANALNDIQNLLANNPIANKLPMEFKKIKSELERVFSISDVNIAVFDKICSSRDLMANKLKTKNCENQTKYTDRTNLVDYISKYLKQLDIFHNELDALSKFDVSYNTKVVTVQGHSLHIENSFKLTPEIFLSAIDHLLKTDKKIGSFSAITPEKLFKSNYKGQSPKVGNYNSFNSIISEKISSLNNKKYKIITKEGKDFDELSPGWKSAVVLDLILGYHEDNAPIIIDQPEDNLATTYINKDLIQLIKDVKSRKQIIIVSHNATIPMLGDAQNVILCKNDDGKIVIRSSPLEGSIHSKSVVDHIAEITDGGKSSVKKRVKKYNLKSYREGEL